MDSLADIKIDSNMKDLELYSDQYPFSLSMKIKTFENEASYNKFIRNVEKLVRGSSEYKDWRNYIIDVLGVNTCMVTSETIAEVTIDVHHHLPGLFTFIKALINKKIEDKEPFSTFDIATETMELHYQNKVGYAVLVKTMHEKFHNGYLDIPVQLIRGNFKEFIAEYGKYLDEDDVDRINARLAINESNCSWTRDNYITEQEATG